MPKNEVVFVPFEAWRPDGSIHGPELEVATGVAPVYGNWRIVKKPRRVSKLTSAETVSGAHSHAHQNALTSIYLRPLSVTETGGTEWWKDRQTGLGYTNGTFPEVLGGAVADFRRYLRVAPAVQGSDRRTLPGGDVRVSSPGDTRVVRRGGGGDTNPELVIRTTDPAEAPGASGDGTLRFFYRAAGWPGGSYELVITALADSTPQTNAVDGVSINGSTDAPWTLKEYAIPEAWIATVDDWATFDVKIQALAGVNSSKSWQQTPTAVSGASAWTSDSGTVDSALDTTASNYAHSPVLAASGDGAQVTVDLGEDNAPDAAVYRYYSPELPGGGWVVLVEAKGTDDGIQLKVELLEGATPIATQSFPLLTTDAAYRIELTSGEFHSIGDWGGLKLRLTASYQTTAVSSYLYLLPNRDESVSGSWTPASSLYAAVDDGSTANDTDFVETSGSGAYIEWGLPGTADPGDNRFHTVTVRARDSAGSGGAITVSLLQGATAIATTINDLTSGFVDYDLDLTAPQAAAITDYNSLRVKVTYTAGSASTLQVSNVYFRSPALKKASVLYAQLESPDTARIELDWVEVELPRTRTTYQPDTVDLYAGTRTKLYQVTDLGFTDVSIAGGYTTGTLEPGAWDFASFGDEAVVATNYVDEVQWRESNTGLFKNLITAPSPAPKARFVAALRGYLVLGDINLTGYYPDQVWWSKLESGGDFLSIDSDDQRVFAGGGQIMGLVGGEFGLVFKRRSLHGMYWIGGEAVFRFEQISNSVGTPYPKSIIKAGGRVFWWDGGAFRALTGEGEPERVGTNVVSRFLTDRAISVAPLEVGVAGGMVEESLRMTAAYDAGTGVISWLYQDVGTDIGRHSKMLLYNTVEDRWALVDDPLLSGSLMVSGFNPSLVGYEPLDGISGFSADGTDMTWVRFDDDVAYEATMVTKVRQVLEDRAVRITGIRPVFTSEPGDNWPPLSVQVDAARDVRMSENSLQSAQGQVRASERQVFPCDIAGNWFRFTVTIPERAHELVQALAGLYVHYQEAGDR